MNNNYAPNNYSNGERRTYENMFFIGSEWETKGGWRCIVSHHSPSRPPEIHSDGIILLEKISPFLVIHMPEGKKPYSVWHRVDGIVREFNGSLTGRNEKLHDIIGSWVWK